MKRYLSFILIFLITVGISSSFNGKSIEASENIFEFSIKETKSQSSSILPEDFPSAYINANNIFTVDIYMTSVGTDRYIDSLQAKWSFDEAKLKFMGVMAFHLKNDPDWMGEQTDVFEKSLVSANYFILGLRMGSEKDKWLFQGNQPTKVATIGFQTINFTTESVLSLGLDFLDINAEIGVAGVTSYDRTKVMTTPLSVASQGEDASLASLTVGGQPISVGSDGSNYNTSITYGDSLLSLETLIKALPTKASAVVTLEKSTTGNVKVNDVVTITVTDGSVSQTHTVTFIDVGSPILELSQLNFLANGYGISPVFNSATTNYQIEIPGAQQATGFSINPVAVESYAITEVYLNNVLQSKVNGKYQFSNLTGGDHTVLVIVKAGGESKNYTLNVNQKVLDSTATIQDFGVVVSKYPTASGTESIDAFGTSTLLENQDKFSFKVNFIESTIKKVDFLVKVDGTQTLAGTLTKNTTIAGQWSYVTGISVPKGKTAEVILNATAENGDTASNTFFVQRAQSSYAELGQSDVLLSENGVDYTAVRSNNIYTYNVREDQTTSLLFKVLSTSNALKENASITLRDADTNALIPGGNISVSAQEGSKSYKIVVVSEDGLVTNEYTLNVVRLSNDLSFSIKVTKTGSLDELLNTASFTLSGSKWIAQTKLAYEVSGVDVFLEASHPNATISIKNNGGGTFATTNQNSLSGSLGYNLVAEQTRTFSVTITAENKVTMDYEISITREKANTINTLESFMIGGNQPGDFIADQVPPTTYQKLVLDPDLTAPTLYVNAEVTGGNTLGYTTVKYEYKRSSDTTYTTGQSITYVRGVIYDVKVTVTSQAGVSNTYLVQMVVADTNNQINDVLIEDASNNGIPFSFDKSKTTYTIEVNAPVASLKFNVTKDSDSASLTSGADANGFVTLLQAGQTTVVKLYLTSESGDKGTEYTFNIVRKAYRTNTDINSIEVIVSNEDGTSSFTPTYDSTRSAYYLRIDSTYYANVVVKATLPTISTGSYFNGNKQVFSETKTIAAGSEATYQIRVVAEDGQTYQDYPVIVKRANQTTTFDHVVLNGQTYTFSQFVAGTLDLRSVEIPFSLSRMDLTIEESDTSRATVELTNPALIDGQWVFNSTGVVEFRFTMLAEDQTTKTTYKIQLTRLQASTDASLKEFQFNSSIGNLLDGVVPVESGNNVTYTIRVDRGVTIDSIVATPNHPNATKNILYTSLDLVSGGEKQFSITVEAEDKTVKKNYHVVIIQKNDNHLVNDISFSGIDYDFSAHVNPVDLGSFLYSTKTFLVTVNREDTYAKVLVDGVLVSLDTNNQFVYSLKQGSQSLTIQTESEFGTKGAIYRYSYTQEVASSEAVLKSLSAKVDGVDLLSGVTLNNLIELSLDRSYNGKTITLLGVADKNGTITSGNTSKALSVGLNTFEVIVRSEDGTTSSTYTIKIYVYSSVSTLNTLSISELSSFIYDQGVTNYDLGLFNYSDHQGKLTLNLTYGDTYAKLYIDGILTTQTSVSHNLKEGSHAISIRVVAEDTQTEVNYRLSYERLSAKTDNNLEGLEVMVGGVNQLENFDPSTLSYELRVDRNITALEILASVNPSALSKVSGAGTKVVNVGVDNTYLVVVTAEDGQTRTYQIKIVSKNDVNEINNIVISGISYDFSSHVNTKDLGSFPYSQKSFTILVEKADPWMTILVDGLLVTLNQNKEFTYTLKQGDNTFSIEGVSEYGTKGESYLYQYTQEVASSEAILKSLSAKVDGVDLLSGVTLNNLIELSLDRSYNGKTITLLGVVDKNGTITSGNTSKALSVGLNTFEVIVQSEDGTTSSTYTIKIYVYSSVSTLNTLSISELSSFIYDNQVFSYDLGVFNYSAHQGKLTLNLTYGDTYAKLYIDGVLTTQTSVSYNLKEGSHVISIRVVAEDTQTEVNYTLSYERLSAKTDNNLEGLEVMVDGVNQLENFDPSTLSYELRVDRNITALEILASVNPSALSKVSGAGTKVVNVGVDNTYLVIVTAEDGQTRTYQIKVVSKNDVNEINNIVISGITYDFSSHVNTKDLGSFPYSQKSLTIRVEKADPFMTILVDGLLVTLNQNKEFTYTLKQGVNTFSIEGVSEYGTKGEAYLYQYTQEVASSEAVLKSLSAKVDGVDLLSGMTLSKLTELEIPRSYVGKTISILGVADHNGTVTGGNGSKALTTGLNTFEVIVKSEDGLFVATYVIKIYVVSDVASITNLSINELSNVVFDKQIHQYDLGIFNYSDYQTFRFNLTYLDQYAKLYVDGSLQTLSAFDYSLKTGTHVIEIKVIAEDLKTEIVYEFYYERLSAKTDNNLEGLEVMVGGVNQLENFDPSTLSYELRVDRNITALEILASVNPSALSKVSGAGTKVVNVGVDNTYLVVVTAEDGQTRTYQIKVVSKNDVNEINNIVISGISYDFSSHINTQDLGSFPYSQKSLTIRVEKADPWMTILVDGVLVTLNQNKEFTYTLKQGDNTFIIEGVSEYGTKGEAYLYQYTQKVASSEAVLKSLSAKVDGVDLLSGMTLNNLIELSLDRSYNGKTITLLGVADKNGTITSGNTSKALSVGLNTFEVIVQSEDGTTSSTYTIKIYVYSSVSTLNTLSISELSSFTYDQGVTSYDLGVFNYSAHQGKLTLNLTYGDTYAKLYIDGVLTTQTSVSYNLKEGSHVISIRVVAEDTQTEVNYTLSYERLSAKTDNNLEGLEVMVGGVNQLENFDPSTLSYELRVDRNITALEILASVNPSALSKVSGAGTKVVNVGVDNTYLVVVTAEDGQTKTYQIKVVSKNDISEINNIVISGITYDFSSHVNMKDLGSFPYSQKSFTIRVEKADPFMTILVDGVQVTLNQNKEFTYTLKQGVNTFSIEGVSEYGTKGEVYLYQYTQEVASSEAVLKSLSAKVDGVDLLDSMTLNHLMEVRIDRINQNKTITLLGVADHNGSVIEGNGLKVIVGGLNTFKFVVRSEDGSVLSEYTLLVYVLNDDNDVADLVLDGNSMDGFEQSTRNYVITTPYTYDTLSVDVLVVMTNTNSRAIITNQGQITLKDGKNVILITVRSEYMNYKNDASKDVVFEIEVTREKAFIDTDLSNLVVTDELGNVLNFDTVVSYKSGIYNYNITLDKTYKLSGITIEATLKNALKQQLTGDTGYFTIIKQADQTIKQTFNFVVSAENNQSKTYSITILQGTTLSSDTTIKSASLRDFFGVEYLSQENAFDKETLTYQINVPYLVTNLNLTVLTNDQKAVVSGSGQYAIMGDYLQISFVVTAEDKSVGETYTIEIHRQQASKNANLNLLEVKDEQGNLLVGLLDDHPTKLVFEQSKLAYRFKLDRSHELVDIFAVSEDPNARVTGDLATQFVLGGVINTLKVLVVAEDGKTQKTYFIYIEVKNSEASLLDLSVDGFSINYQPTIDTYDLGQVSKEVQQINIQGVLGDDYMSVTGLGRQVLTDGLNRFLVVITSDDLTTKKTYEILVTKEKSNDGSISEDNVLYDLLVEGTKYSYDLEFDELTYVYDLTLAYEDDKFFLNGIKNPRASLTGGGLYALNPGDTKTIVVYVTAEDGTKGQNYLVNVTREEPSDLNQLLEFYVIENGVRYDLDETKTYQEITVNEHTSEITFGGVWPSNSKVTGLGVVSVIGSEKLYTIIVTSQSGNSKAYNVQVLKTSTDNLLSDLMVKDTKTGDILDYDPVFNPTTLNYMIDLTLRSDVIEVEIIATKNHAGAMVKGDGIHSLRSGVGMTTDRFNVTVTAQDGLSERTYVITISRNIDPNDDITIDELSLYGNTTLFLGNHVYPMALTQFTTSQLEYEITVPYQTSRMLLQVTNQNGATVYGAGEQIINENEVLIAFFLVSKSGKVTSDTYVIRVIKEEPNSDNTLKSLQINGVLIDGFNPNLTNYELTVDSDKVSQLHVQATKNHSLSTLSGDLGNMPITRGKNTINITVVSESNESKVYQIVINAYSFDNTLLALGVENYDLDSVFDVNTLTYIVEVPYDVNMVNITGKAKNTSIITGLGVKSLAIGSNVFIIYVTSESGLEGKRYQIEVYRTEASDDTTLENLVVKDKNGNILSFTSPFNKDIKDYVINLDPSTNLNSVIVEGIASNENASVYGVGNVLLGGFVDGLYHTIIKVSVMAESGLVEEYTISFYRGIVLDDQAEIETLDLFGSNSLNYLGTQSNAQSIFDVSIKTYTIYVPHDVKNMNLMVTATGIVYGAGIKVFGLTNELTYTVRVTSKSGATSSETYTINVIKQEAQTDNLLDSILIDGLALKDFDPNKTNYLIQIPMNPNKTSIYLDVQGKENQQIQGVGNKQLNPGENVFNLLVTAQNGEIKTYTVVVNYVDSNALLDSLYVKGSSEQTYKEETSITYFDQNSFDKLTFSYVVKVDVSTRYVRLTGTTEDQQSGARVQGFRTYEFKTSEPTKTIEIEVVSADGLQSQIYTILLTRDGVSDTDARLTSLVVEGKKLAFNPSMYHYQVSVGAKQETLKLSAQSFSPNAKVSVLGYEYLGESNELSIELDRLDVGKNEVLIKVEAQDGSIMYYRLSITKDSQPDYLLSVLLIITFLLWVITVAFFLVKLSRNKKQTTRRGLII